MSFEMFLLMAVLLVVLFVAYKVYELSGIGSERMTSTLKDSILDSGLSEELGRIENHASEIKKLHSDISKMLRTPKERGSFGEEQLEIILSDHLPEDMYGVRERGVGGKVPDAYIETSEGKVCIDSKFPLDNFEKISDDESAAKKFREDVRRQLEKIKEDYVRPDEGTVNTAFAFIPSESVYYYLVTEEFEMVREFASKGVQLVSPLTLGHKLQLIKADIRSRKMSEKAEMIQEKIEKISQGFQDFAEEWSILRRHVSNAESKVGDVDSVFRALKRRFESVSERSL